MNGVASASFLASDHAPSVCLSHAPSFFWILNCAPCNLVPAERASTLVRSKSYAWTLLVSLPPPLSGVMGLPFASVPDSWASLVTVFAMVLTW